VCENPLRRETLLTIGCETGDWRGSNYKGCHCSQSVRDLKRRAKEQAAMLRCTVVVLSLLSVVACVSARKMLNSARLDRTIVLR